MAIRSSRDQYRTRQPFGYCPSGVEEELVGRKLGPGDGQGAGVLSPVGLWVRSWNRVLRVENRCQVLALSPQERGRIHL